MIRISFRRSITACVFAAVLLVAGATPAAASEGPAAWGKAWSWLTAFWGETLDRFASITAADACVNGDCGPEIDPDGSTVNGDCGPEIDPNGCPKPRGTAGTGSGS